MSDLETELLKLKNLFDEDLISKDVYEKRQSEILNSYSIEKKNISDKSTEKNSAEVKIYENELIHHGISASIFFDDDLLNHNNLKRVDYYKMKLFNKFEEDAQQIRFVNMYWSTCDQNSSTKKIFIIPEQNPNATNKNFRQNVFGGPFIEDLIQVCGDYDKKFKNNNYEVDNFILIINVDEINSFHVHPVDTSTISGFKNFVDTWGSNKLNKTTKQYFEETVVVKIKSNCLLKKINEKEFHNIETSFTFLHDDIELEKIFGEIVKRQEEKIHLREINNLHPYNIDFKMSDL